jgi:hypothetical protein
MAAKSPQTCRKHHLQAGEIAFYRQVRTCSEQPGAVRNFGVMAGLKEHPPKNPRIISYNQNFSATFVF